MGDANDAAHGLVVHVHLVEDEEDGAFGDAEGAGYLVVGVVQFVLEDEEGDLLRCQGVVVLFPLIPLHGAQQRVELHQTLQVLARGLADALALAQPVVEFRSHMQACRQLFLPLDHLPFQFLYLAAVLRAASIRAISCF